MKAGPDCGDCEDDTNREFVRTLPSYHIPIRWHVTRKGQRTGNRIS